MFTVKQLRALLANYPEDAPVTMTDQADEEFTLEDFAGSMVESPYLSFVIPGVVYRE
ncbi:MAG: hypothetical protein ABSA65_16380 [Acidimicrobiales bacterium]|jgi:hypothetical protein